MAGWIGVHDPDTVGLLQQAGEDDRPEFLRPVPGCSEVGHGQVQMKLLWRAVRPFGREIGKRTLEGELGRSVTRAHLTPLGITDVRPPVQKLCVEGRKGRRIGAVEDDRAQRNRR